MFSGVFVTTWSIRLDDLIVTRVGSLINWDSWYNSYIEYSLFVGILKRVFSPKKLQFRSPKMYISLFSSSICLISLSKCSKNSSVEIWWSVNCSDNKWFTILV